jgi:1-acylglycerone phosphate reductase
VHVLTVITGGVISNIARTKRTLPADSIFKPIESAYQRRLGTSQEAGIDTRTYANSAVKAALGARGWLWNTNEAWLGGGARLIWFVESLDWWTPGGLWQRVMARRFGIPRTMEAPESRKNK